MGNNLTASQFSGVQVNKIKVILFTLYGFMSSVTALFLTSRMGSTRPNVATGYEMDVIAMLIWFSNTREGSLLYKFFLVLGWLLQTSLFVFVTPINERNEALDMLGN